MSTRKPDNKHLVRIVDTKGTKGWQLRVPRYHPLFPYTEYFADAKFGGLRGALAAAKVKREALIERQGFDTKISPHSAKEFGNAEAVGISFAYDARRPLEKAFSWVAYWNESTSQKKIGFSLNSYGFDAALQAAVEAREVATKVVVSEEAILQSALLGVLKLRKLTKDKAFKAPS